VKRPLEERAFTREAVDVRRLHIRMPARAELVETEIVDQYDEKVGSPRHGVSFGSTIALIPAASMRSFAGICLG
jgi:hypothetical protein